MKTSKTILTLLLAFVLILLGRAEAAAANTLTLKFYNSAGTALTFAQVQTLQVGPRADAYEADAYLDPVTLRLVKAAPLTDASGFTMNLVAGQAVAFAINWPTATQGYGLIILDNGGAGFTATTTVNFTYQAAKDLKRKLDNALATRPDYTHSTAFDTAYAAAASNITAADQGATDAVKGSKGQLALDQLVVAYDLMLKEYGPVYARAHQSQTMPWLGFTMEDVSNYRADLDKLAAMAGPYAWVRIVFQPEDAPSVYTAAVNYAKSKGIKILGEPVDSIADSEYTHAQCIARFQTFINAFPQIDAWEVGNEVNGGWSSADVGSRIAEVAAYCKALGKKTYLTLFWQINTADQEFAMFNWIAANLPPAVRANLDYVGFSQYQEQAPMGAAFDQVMRRMQVEFPTQKIGIGELGYWIDGQQYWWAYNSNVTTAKDKVVDQYYNAALGYAGSHGACFWWNYASAGPEYDFDAKMTNSIVTLKNFLQSSGGVVHSAPVRLTMTRNNNMVRVAWPAVPGAVLEKTLNPNANPVVWTTVATNQYSIVGGENSFTTPASTWNSFYRLRQP